MKLLLSILVISSVVSSSNLLACSKDKGGNNAGTSQTNMSSGPVASVNTSLNQPSSTRTPTTAAQPAGGDSTRGVGVEPPAYDQGYSSAIK